MSLFEGMCLNEAGLQMPIFLIICNNDNDKNIKKYIAL